MARGRRGGRKPVVTDEKLRRAQTLVTQGLTVREAAARIKVGKTALYAALAQTVSEHIEGNYPPPISLRALNLGVLAIRPGSRGSHRRGLRRGAGRCRRLFAHPLRLRRPTWRDSRSSLCAESRRDAVCAPTCCW